MKVKILFVLSFLFIFNVSLVYSYDHIELIEVKPTSFNLTAPEYDSLKIYKSKTIVHPDTIEPQGRVVAGDIILFIVQLFGYNYLRVDFNLQMLDSVITFHKGKGSFLLTTIDTVNVGGNPRWVGVFQYITDPTPGLIDTVWFVFKDSLSVPYQSDSVIFKTIKAPILVSIPKILALQGETFDIPITAKSGYTVSDSILSFEFGVRFDSTILTFNSASSATGSSIEYSKIKDTIYVSSAKSSPLTSVGDLVKLNFTVKNATTYHDSSILKITKSIFNEGIPYAVREDGQVSIRPLFGDADRNKIVEPLDATEILKYRVNLAVIDSVDSIHADVSGNGMVTAFDAGLILQWLVKQLRRFPVEDFLGLKPALLNLNAEAIVYVEPDLIEFTEEYKTVSVELKNINEVYSLEMILNYNSEFFRFTDYKTTDLTNDFVIAVNDVNGKILVAMTSNKPIKNDGKIIKFIFRKSNDTNDEFYFSEFMINEQRINNKLQYTSHSLNYLLYQNYPNPFNPETEIKFSIPEASDVELTIYNLLGREVITLVKERKEKGFYTVKWDSRDSKGMSVSSGVYFYRLKAGSFISTKKMILIK